MSRNVTREKGHNFQRLGAMEQISKTMRDRLAAQQTASDHPDADLLTAYAENTLQNRERDTVMTHLARCKTCRDLALLAAPELPAVAPAPSVITPEPRRRWFARPVLGWVTGAAAIAIVGAAVTLNVNHSSYHSLPAAKDSAAVANTPASPQATSAAPQPSSNEVATYLAPQTKSEQSVQTRAKKSAPVASKPVVLDQYAALQQKPSTSAPAVFAFGEPSRTDATRHTPTSLRAQNSMSIGGPVAGQRDVTASLHPPAAP